MLSKPLVDLHPCLWGRRPPLICIHSWPLGREQGQSDTLQLEPSLLSLYTATSPSRPQL